MRTFCEHFLCDGVHLGHTTGACVLLESEPLLDSPHGPKGLVMRRSASSNPVIDFTADAIKRVKRESGLERLALALEYVWSCSYFLAKMSGNFSSIHTRPPAALISEPGVKLMDLTRFVHSSRKISISLRVSPAPEQ